MKLMSKDEQAIQALQYLWDEGFLRLYVKDGEPMVALTTEVSEAHDAIRVRFKKKQDPADWWKNETKK